MYVYVWEFFKNYCSKKEDGFDLFLKFVFIIICNSRNNMYVFVFYVCICMCFIYMYVICMYVVLLICN